LDGYSIGKIYLNQALLKITLAILKAFAIE